MTLDMVDAAGERAAERRAVKDCPGCALPEPLADGLYGTVWFPQGHTLKKLRDYLSRSGIEHDIVDHHCLRVRNVDPRKTVMGLIGSLTEPEKADTRVLFASTETPELGDFGRVLSVKELAERYKGEWLILLLTEKRYHSVAQPIVSAIGNEVIGHEFLFRGTDEDGSELSPGTIFSAAKDPKILFNLDRAARINAVETGVKAKLDGKFFVNFMPGSVYDPRNCLRTTVNAIERLGVPPERVVFEIVETEKITDLEHLRGLLSFYRNSGFKVALDDFGAGFNNLSTLLALSPDYLKLDKTLTQGSVEEAYRTDMIGGLTAQCRRQGVEVIGEGIEDQETAEHLVRLGVDYLQGYHFGRPKKVL